MPICSSCELLAQRPDTNTRLSPVAREKQPRGGLGVWSLGEYRCAQEYVAPGSTAQVGGWFSFEGGASNPLYLLSPYLPLRLNRISLALTQRSP